MSANRPIVPPRLVLGMVTFVVGALFLADGAGWLRADSIWAFWPVAVLALGLVVVLQPDPANRMLGALLLIAGAWLLLNAVGAWTYRFWHTWPYLLMLFGAWMLYRVHSLQERERHAGWVTGFAFLNSVARQASRAPTAAGQFSAVGGTCSVDLSDVEFSGAGLVIDVFALFGRVTLHVPAGWRVEVRVLPLLGRISDTTPSPAAGPAVVVQGSAIGSSIVVAPSGSAAPASPPLAVSP